jgi:ankyrin repeat protein
LSIKDSLEFFEAVKFNKIEVVEDILKISKDYLFDFDYFQQTAYHWAAKRGFKDLLEVLIHKGVHVNLYDFNKRTPLFLAALNNHREICLVLLTYGANPFLEDKEGKKPVDVTTDGTVKQLLMKTMEVFLKDVYNNILLNLLINSIEVK